MDGQAHQAVALVTELAAEEAEVASYEGGAPALHQKADDLLVVETFSADIYADLAGSDSPPVKDQTLTREDVLVQKNHAGAGWSV
jgi:hypothetical protein